MDLETAPTLQSLDLEDSPNLNEKDLAFLQSADGVRTVPFGLSGEDVELQAFDTHRQIAAQKLGMEFFNMGEEALHEFQERETYNGIFLDAVIVVYLCTHPRSTAKKALRAPNAVRDEALNWAERQNIRAGNQKHAALIEAFGAILNDILLSYAEPDETNQAEGESLGES